MSAEFQIVRPSETPTLAHRAFVDSPHRCTWCGKRQVIEIRYDAEQRPYESHECLNCSPHTSWTGE